MGSYTPPSQQAFIPTNRTDFWNNQSLILASVSDAVIVTDAQLFIRIWNRAAEELFGWRADELIGQPIQIILTQVTSIDTQAWQEAFLHLTQHARWQAEANIIERNGKQCAVEIDAQIIQEEEGCLQGIVAVCRDITERRRAEAEREELLTRERVARAEAEAAQHRLTFLAEASTLLSTALNYHRTIQMIVQLIVPRMADCCILDLFDDYKQLQRVAFAHADSEKQRVLEQLHREYSSHFSDDPANINAILDTGQAYLTSHVPGNWVDAFARDAQHRQYLMNIDVESSIIVPLIARNRPLGILHLMQAGSGRHFSAQDVTTAEELAWRAAAAIDNARLHHDVQEALRHKADALAELSRHQAQLAGIIDSAMDAIITVDSDQRIVLFNATAERLFGCTASGVIGQPINRFIPQSHREGHQQYIQYLSQSDLTTSATHSPATLVALRSSGETFPIEASISQINVDEQKFYTIILRDISERKRLEAQFLQAQKMESVGRLAGGIAHDFNNLLTAIGGYTALALDILPPDHVVSSDLLEVQRATERAATLTRQLLAFARKQVIEPQVFNLNGLIGTIEKLLRRLIGEDVELTTQLATDLGQVKADPGQIEQILVNLAVNARDAMPDGGCLTIETANIEIDDSYNRSHVGVIPGLYVMLAVSDTGVGITPEVQARIFEPFFTTKAPGKGTGLGLATCYGIVKQHGGNIWIYSEPGQGTTVKVYLPQVNEAPYHLPHHDEPVDLPNGNEAVLLVEDEPAVLALEARLLRERGYTVFEARNGEMALQVAEQHKDIPIHIVITDVIMPIMGGKQLVERLSIRRPNIRVLYTSGYTNNVIIHQAQIDAGVAFLQKPFSTTTLARKVREVLDSDPPVIKA